MPPRARVSPAPALGLLLLVAGLLRTPACAAQLPWRDPLPWAALADSVAAARLEVGAGWCRDASTGWNARRFAAEGLLPRRDGLFFVRFSIWTLDTADLRAVQRWPALVGEAGDGWPGEARSAGLGNPELGWLSGARLPLLGRAQLGLAASLPFGRDALYPFAATALALRLQLRRPVSLGAGREFAVAGGQVVSLGSALDRLDGAAHPASRSLGLALAWRGRAGRGVMLGGTGEWGGGAEVLMAGVRAALPAGEGALLGLGLQQALGNAADRPFSTLISVTYAVGGATAAPPSVAK